MSARVRETIISAGHLPALLYRASSSQVEEIPSAGIALGLMPDATYTSQGTSLERGDILCLYTDGITEARH